MNYILLILGFILLIKGADIFVDGASNVSKKLGIPSIIVGLTIVSLGTSAPELSVSVLSSLKGNNDMAVGNVLGSNIFNILMVLGATTLFAKTVINKKDSIRDYLVTLGSSFLFLIITFTTLLDKQKLTISRLDGVILITACVVYILMLIKNTLNNKGNHTESEDFSNIKLLPNVIKILVGVVGIAIGGNFVVDSASAIAVNFGMSEKLVALTIVAIGTSLPELVTSVVAARKGETEIALGNVLGSMIFNILLIIGVSAVISPIMVGAELTKDFIFLILIIILLGVFIYCNKKEIKEMTKLEGLIFVSLYIGYTTFIIFRN